MGLRHERAWRAAMDLWRSVAQRFFLNAMAALGLISVVATTSPLRANEPASVIVVFDGSGSMWGNLEGTKESKLVLAREAVRRGLGKINPQTRVGLAAFGHRRGDCSDVEVIKPPEPLEAARILEPLEKLNPRGRGPLTLALREAAKVLAPGPGKKTLILIHDDADNCQQDICGAAEELRAANIVVQVVGLGLKAEDVAKMACVPQLTRGRFFSASGAAEISSAVEQVLLIASGSALPDLPTGLEIAASAARVAADAPPGLHLRALLANDTEPINWPLHWSVSAETRPSEMWFNESAVKPFVPVPPGRYVVEAKGGLVWARQLVQVDTQAPTRVVSLVLDAGMLRVKASQVDGNAPLEDVALVIESVEATSELKNLRRGKQKIAYEGAEQETLLPAGRYTVRVEQSGSLRAQRTVVVPAGSLGRLDIAVRNTSAPRKLAFVVGIDRYDNLGPQQQLLRAVSDSRAMGLAMASLGFDVIAAEDTARGAFNEQWQAFLDNTKAGDTVAIYFSGHGVEIEGLNFLIPRDVPNIRYGRQEQLKRESLSVSELLLDLYKRRPRIALLILDACRDHPFISPELKSASSGSGLARMDAPEGTFIMYSAGASETALDRLPGNDPDKVNSVYTRRLLPLMKMPGLRLPDLAQRVRSEVHDLAASVGHKQRPAYYDGLIGDFCLAGCEPK